MAGQGIEYIWGFIKKWYRKHNDCVSANFLANVNACMAPELLPIERIYRMARKARTYTRAYAAIDRMDALNETAEDGVDALDRSTKFEDAQRGRAQVEKLVKTSKTHRCTMHQEGAMLDAEVEDADITVAAATAAAAAAAATATTTCQPDLHFSMHLCCNVDIEIIN